MEVFDLLAGYSHLWLDVMTFLVRPCCEGLEKLSLPSLTTLSVRPRGSADSATNSTEAIWQISYGQYLFYYIHQIPHLLTYLLQFRKQNPGSPIGIIVSSMKRPTNGENEGYALPTP